MEELITVYELAELNAAAKKLLEFAAGEKIFLFYGDMGVGKTTFIKAICKELDVKEMTSSPTFSIVNEYKGTNVIIYHFDFYRIKNETEAFDIGFEDYIYSGNYCFIEWPEKIPGLLPHNAVEVFIEVVPNLSRNIKINVKAH